MLRLCAAQELVKQQAGAIGRETGLVVKEYKGGLALPLDFQVLVSTPAAFINHVGARVEFDLATYAVVTFDEVHHCIRNHPYVVCDVMIKLPTCRALSCLSVPCLAVAADTPHRGLHPTPQGVAEIIRGLDDPPQVLGLTASLTYSVHQRAIEESARALCSTLRIQTVYNASKERLRAGGYHAADTPLHVHAGAAYDRDVIAFDEDDAVCHRLELLCGDHDLLGGFVAYIQASQAGQAGGARVHPVTSQLWATMLAVEALLVADSPGYRAPWRLECVHGQGEGGGGGG
jgi:hypothetical protein